jgi:hypothetical protein
MAANKNVCSKDITVRGEGSRKGMRMEKVNAIEKETMFGTGTGTILGTDVKVTEVTEDDME